MAERTGDDHGVRAEGLRPFKDAAGKAGGNVAAGNAHGCAAAFRLQGERHDFGAEGGHDVVHGHRVLGVVKLHDVRGAAHQAAVVAGDLDAFEGLLDLFGDGAGAVVLHQDLEDGYGFGQLFGAGIVEKGVDLIAERLVLHTVLGGLQVGEAARAGRAHAFGAFGGGKREVARGKRGGEHVIASVGRRGAAAAPVGNFLEADFKRAADGAGGTFVFGGRPLTRTAGVIGEFHLLVPLGAALLVETLEDTGYSVLADDGVGFEGQLLLGQDARREIHIGENPAGAGHEHGHDAQFVRAPEVDRTVVRKDCQNDAMA